jgi:hypothetical protein
MSNISIYPTKLPDFLNTIPNEGEKSYWNGFYVESYRHEQVKLSQECYGIKAAMSGVSISAPLAFATLSLFTLEASKLLIAASVISLNTFGITAGICAIVYFTEKYEQNYVEKSKMFETMSIRIETLYRQSKHLPPMAPPQ